MDSLMDPVYDEIGPNTYVGMTRGGWSSYSWVAGLILMSVILIFLLDFAAERYVEIKYGQDTSRPDIEGIITDGGHSQTPRAGGQDDAQRTEEPKNTAEKEGVDMFYGSGDANDPALVIAKGRSFHQQIAAFLILEFGVIFHSVIIGLNL